MFWAPSCLLIPGYSVDTHYSRLRGYDPDGDSLAFGVTGAGSGLVRLEARDEYSADVFLRRDLDHEVGIMMCIMGQGLTM